MTIRKRVMMIVAVVSILIFAIAGIIYLQPINKEKSTEAVALENDIIVAEKVEEPFVDFEMTERVLPGMEADNIFFAQDFDYIAMYGDPKNWDDEKDMAIDKNGDDEKDMFFKIASSRYDGIDLEGSVKQSDGSWKSVNFWSADLFGLFRNHLQDKAQVRAIKAKDFLTLEISGLFSLLQEGKYIVKGCCIVDDDYVQISICDIDEDGLDEVLVSVGNRLNESATAIYELSNEGKSPFTYCGCIYCDTVLEYKGNRILWAYRGNLKDKLHDTYIIRDLI